MLYMVGHLRHATRKTRIFLPVGKNVWNESCLVWKAASYDGEKYFPGGGASKIEGHLHFF